MVQTYLLSVIANIVAGAFLSSRLIEAKILAAKGFEAFVNGRPRMRLIAAIIAFAVGILLLINPINGDIPIVGDLLPALAGLVMGYCLWLEWFKGRRPEISSWPFVQLSDRFLLSYRDQIGLAGMAIAVLHFLVPSVILL